jgi:hypothetical protein
MKIMGIMVTMDIMDIMEAEKIYVKQSKEKYIKEEKP